MENYVRRFATGLASVGWTVLLLQFYLTTTGQMAEGRGFWWGVVLYFGYFTLTTNALCAVVATAFALPDGWAARWEWWRQPWLVTSAMASIVIVGSIYFLLLRHQYHPEGLQWVVDRFLHYLIPPAFVVFWWRAVPHGHLHWLHLPPMMAYPSAYFGYLLVRGEMTGAYPYFFIDVSRLGYAQVLMNACGFCLLFLVLAALGIRTKR
jgi:hypothetical protein